MAGDKELHSDVKQGSHCDFGSDQVTDQAQEKDAASAASGSKIEEALNQSVKDLEMLEKFYQQRGKTERAVEISLTLRRMRSRNRDGQGSQDVRLEGH